MKVLSAARGLAQRDTTEALTTTTTPDGTTAGEQPSGPCNPLADSCGPDSVCTLDNGSVDPFECHPDDSGDGGGAIEPCLAYNSCDDGLLCYPGEYVPGCDGSLCCTPFCDVTRPDACAELGMVCELWYLPDQAPRGLENLGVCAKL